MDYKEKNAKLEEELQATKEHLEKYTAPASNSGARVIAEAIRKGKVKSGSRFYKDYDALNNSSHSLNDSSHSHNDSSHSLNDSSHSLNDSSHSRGNETESNGRGNSKTNRVLIGRYADQDKVTTKQRFTTESREQFQLPHRTPKK